MQPLLQTFCPLGMLKIVFRDSSLFRSNQGRTQGSGLGLTAVVCLRGGERGTCLGPPLEVLRA